MNPTLPQKPLEGAALLPRLSIRPNPDQPRKAFPPGEMAELADSLRTHGVLQPLLVRYKPARYDGTPYLIIGGERRWRASDGVLDELPVIIKEASDEEAAVLAIVDNLQRVDLTPYEEAEAIRALVASGLSKREVARRISKERGLEGNEVLSDGWVSNRIGLLKSGKDVQEVAAQKPNAMSSLLLIETVKEPETRRELLDQVQHDTPFKTIQSKVETHRHAEEQKQRAAKYDAPDRETKERSGAQSRGESSSVSRGRRVTGPKREEVRTEVERALKTLEVWAPRLSEEDFETLIRPVARRLLRGDLAR